MGKKTVYEPKGQATIWGPKKQKGPDFGDILGGIVAVFVIFVIAASCAG